MIKFYINKNIEINELSDILSGWSGMTPEERAKQYEIPIEVVKKHISNKESQELINFINKRYIENKEELENLLTSIQEFWQLENNFYKNKIETIIEEHIPSYTCTLNVNLSGTTGWYDRNLSVNAFYYKQEIMSKNKFILILLGELILSITFHKVRQDVSQEELDDNQVWGIGELTSSIIINDLLNIKMNTGYKELDPISDVFYDFYNNRLNFNDYIEKSIKYFKKNPLSKGCS